MFSLSFSAAEAAITKCCLELWGEAMDKSGYFILQYGVFRKILQLIKQPFSTQPMKSPTVVYLLGQTR